MSLLQVLKLIDANKYAETYRYFPDVILSGGQFIDKEAVDNLMAEGYLKEIKKDSFGRFFGVSGRGKAMLRANAGSHPAGDRFCSCSAVHKSRLPAELVSG